MIVVVLLGLVGFLGYSEYKERADFKKEVVEHLTKKGYTPEEYSSPKYVEREIVKGQRLKCIEIIFNKEQIYDYYYAATSDGIILSAVINRETGERDYDKTEPLK